MTTLSKLSFQEKGHGLFKKKEETCSRKHAEKKVGHMKVQVFKRKKKSWTLEGPSIQKRERER